MSTAAKAYLSIGEVLTMLRADFPDVTISKIRFLEAEGLVEPDRTAAGYRKFSRSDVGRLRYVLMAQRDQYLPLRVIRDHLEAMDRGMAPSAVAAQGASGAAPSPRVPLSVVEDPVALPGPEDFAPPLSELRMSRQELLDVCGLEAEQLRQLEDYGLLAPVPGGEYFDAHALAVGKAAAGLSRFGVEPRHLRTFRMAADREISLIRQVLTPIDNQRSSEARQRSEEVTKELAALSVGLHHALVRAGLQGSRTR